LPACCPCGVDFPTVPNTIFRRVLTACDDAFWGNDPLMSENLLRSYRAAQRYHYDFESIGKSSYRVLNPTTKKTYVVTLSDVGKDDCDCDTFFVSRDTCIHIEHIRIRLGLPSPSSQMSEASTFAYAWFDKSTLPARIRIGVQGNIEQPVRA